MNAPRTAPPGGATAAPGGAPVESLQPARPAEPQAAVSVSGACDPAVERARRAGGPIDQAVYTCGCGYLFSAAVSTTVVCPHCGADQAW